MTGSKTVASRVAPESFAGTPVSEGGALLVSSRQLTLLEHFRIPYAVDMELRRDGVEQLRAAAGGPTLFWKASSTGRAATAATVLGADRTTHVPVFALLLADPVVEPLLASRGVGWCRVRALSGSAGEELGSIWRSQDGSVFLPFDPDEVILNYWSERYLGVGGRTGTRGLKRIAMACYYRVRPLLARPLQIWLRRQFARLQARSQFPRWPIETCLHDFFDLMLAIVNSIAGESLPSIAPWPQHFRWALVLTHDVERAEGWAALNPVLALERAHGVRSSWNVVPRGCYDVDSKRVRKLVDDGFEVGVHGLHHDGRDLASLPVWHARLSPIRSAAARWGAVGFRAPALHRRWDWMPLLELDYDSSVPDTDPFEPQAGGCCTWLPFFNSTIVELPLTLTQDHTLFVILRGDGEAAWSTKARFLRSRGGMAVLDTHPDYLLDRRILTAYGRFLDQFASDPTAWKALPREVSAWWRRRAASSLERDGRSWRVIGPASDEARIEFLGGSW